MCADGLLLKTDSYNITHTGMEKVKIISHTLNFQGYATALLICVEELPSLFYIPMLFYLKEEGADFLQFSADSHHNGH